MNTTKRASNSKKMINLTLILSVKRGSFKSAKKEDYQDNCPGCSFDPAGYDHSYRVRLRWKFEQKWR